MIVEVLLKMNREGREGNPYLPTRIRCNDVQIFNQHLNKYTSKIILVLMY